MKTVGREEGETLKNDAQEGEEKGRNSL